MAEKKIKAETKAKNKMRFKGQIFLIFATIAAAVFLPSTVVLCVGLLPTIAARLVDKSRKKTKIVTVAAMNIAGCAPFLFELWSSGHDLEGAIGIVSDPMAIVVMYAAAAIGYLIDWALAGLVASVLYQRGLARQKSIQERQQELIERWGPEVTGELRLDEQGFPIVQPQAAADLKA